MALTMTVPLAAVLLAGLWCEADDQGVFLWKPITIKARVLPAANVDMADLLEALESHRFIARFTVGGKEYGAIRNFRVWQRPKKPNATHPLPDEFRTFVGLKPVTSEPVENQFPTSGENPPQMEEVGGRREEVGSNPPVSPLPGEPPPGPKPSARKRGKRALPADFEPDHRIAAREGRSAEWSQRQFERLQNWALANDVRKADWQRTFDNWCLRSIDDDKPRAGTGPPLADQAEVDRLFREKSNAH